MGPFGKALLAGLASGAGALARRLRRGARAAAGTTGPWREALEAVGDGAWEWDPAAGHLLVSPAGWRLLGHGEVGPPVPLGDLGAWVHPDDLPAVLADARAHLAGATPAYRNEHRLRCRDGGYKWVLSRGLVTERAADGTPLRMLGTYADVSERRRLEGELRAAARRLDAVLAAAPAGIVILDADRRVRMANPAAAGFLAAGGDAAGLPVRAAHGDDAQFEEAGRRLYPLLAAGGVAGAELRLRRHDGTTTWAQVVGRRVDAADPAQGTVWVAVDIGDRKRAERRLAESLRFQRTLVDTIPLPVFVRDRAGRYVDANAAFARWLGRDRAGLAGRLVEELFPPAAAGRFRASDEALLADPGQETLRATLEDGRGVARDLEIVEATFCDAAGAPLGVLGVFVDVSERNRAEGALRERERFFRQMFEGSLAVKLLVDPADGRVIDANPAAAAYYGYPLEALRGMRVADLNCLPAAEVREEMARAARAERLHFEFRHRLASGEVRDVEVYSSPLDMGGRRLLLSLVHDVTKRHEAEAALRRLATTDPLTGLANRRHFLGALAAEVARARRHGRALSVLMLDVDHFKRVNDRLGHAAGDEALRGVAGACREALRESDLAGRLGGEEFAVLLPETPLGPACEAAGRLRRALAGREVATPAGTFRVTASLGVACLGPEDRDAEALLARADRALYRAKAGGRDRVEADGPEGPGPGPAAGPGGG